MKFFSKKLASQLKRPSGLFGSVVAEKMQQRNTATYNWMFSNMQFPQTGNILEVGYGTGKMLLKVAENYPVLKLYGIDFSKVMYKKAMKNGAGLTKTGRLRLSYGNILDYSPEIKFNIIFGINVIYFWDDLIPYFRKINSLLNNNSRVYIYLTDQKDLRAMEVTSTDVFNKHTLEDILKAAKECGFTDSNYTTTEKSSIKGHCLTLIK